MFKDLEDLVNTIRERKSRPKDSSYTNKLLKNKNLNIKKVRGIGELIEAIDKDTNKIHEAADTLYHLMVLLEGNGVKIEDVMEELKKRKKN